MKGERLGSGNIHTKKGGRLREKSGTSEFKKGTGHEICFVVCYRMEKWLGEGVEGEGNVPK